MHCAAVVGISCFVDRGRGDQMGLSPPCILEAFLASMLYGCGSGRTLVDCGAGLALGCGWGWGGTKVRNWCTNSSDHRIHRIRRIGFCKTSVKLISLKTNTNQFIGPVIYDEEIFHEQATLFFLAK